MALRTMFPKYLKTWFKKVQIRRGERQESTTSQMMETAPVASHKPSTTKPESSQAVHLPLRPAIDTSSSSAGIASSKESSRVTESPLPGSEKAESDCMEWENQHLYQPLDASRQEIRILLLSAIELSDNLLRCHLSTASLEDRPPYMALSYTWGDPNDAVAIICDGHIVRITRSLGLALLHIRDTFLEADNHLDCIPIWADGICINQEDLTERSQQVQIMDLIYLHSYRTILWLGPEYEDSSFALETTEKLASDAIDPSEPTTWSQIPEVFEFRFWDALDALFCRAYWSRVWTLQEVALSYDVLILCGTKYIPWDTLVTAVDFCSTIEWRELWNIFPPKVIRAIQNNHYVNLDSFKRLRQNSNPFHGKEETLPLLVAMIVSLHKKCSNPRDKLYGILGVCDDDYKPVPDYTKPVCDIYTDIISRKLRHGHNVPCLLLAGTGIFRREDLTCKLPSWVCDWNAWANAGPGVPYQPAFFVQRLCYNAAGDSQSTISTIPGRGILRTKAIYLDQITHVDEIENWSISFWNRFPPYSETQTKYPTGIPQLQAVFRTLLADNDRGPMKRLGEEPEVLAKLIGGFFFHLATIKAGFERIRVSELSALTAFASWLNDPAMPQDEVLKLVERSFLGENLQHLADEIQHIRENPRKGPCQALYDNRVGFNTQRTQIFETKSGYMGLGPKFAQVGDNIYVLPGIQVPFVIRQHDHYCELVGACFVLGFMDGEAMELLRAGKTTLQDINIQ